MAVWKYACKTIQGINLDLKLVGRKDLPLKLTRAASGSGNISPTQLMGLTEIIDPVQELQLLDVIEHIDEKRVMIPVILRNPTVKKSYSMYQIGIYAEDPDLGEILYIVLQSEGAEEIPSGVEMKDFKLEWYINLSVSNSENIEVVIDETGVLTVEQADARYVHQSEYDQTIEGIMNTAKTDKEELKKDIGEAGKQASEYTDKKYQQVTEETDEKIKELHIENKVDKVAGKGLSTNDYTTEDKTKLSGIASGAEVNVQADWNVTNTKSDAYIKNKPQSMPASDVPDWAKQPQKPQYTKGEIGLGNVNNTSDASKPVSTAQQAAIDAAYQQSTAYADLIVNALINGAPGDLDTIGELAQAMENNNDVVAVLRAAIGTKADQSELDGHTGNNTIHITATERKNWNDANSKKHSHSNKSVLDAITDTIVDTWNSAVTHISDAIKHITAAERKKWNNGSANYGTCSTAAATAAKTVACPDFELDAGAEITVKFTVTNTAAKPTLNVNSTGAKPVYYRGAAITAGYLAANRTYTFRYNGTQYELVGDIDTNSKYSNMTAATADAAGKSGLVPAPAAGAQEKYFRGDGTFESVDDHVVAFESGDKINPTGWEGVQVVTSGEKLSSLMQKFSLFANNVRYVWTKLGNTDLSGIGNGTVTGAISKLNKDFTDKFGGIRIDYSVIKRDANSSTTMTQLFTGLSPCICMLTTENVSDKPTGKYGTIVIFKYSDTRAGAICICTDGTVYHNAWNASSNAVTGWK